MINVLVAIVECYVVVSRPVDIATEKVPSTKSTAISSQNIYWYNYKTFNYIMFTTCSREFVVLELFTIDTKLFMSNYNEGNCYL